MSIREVTEGVQEVGVDEQVVFTLDTTNVGGSPSSPVVVAKRESDWTVVTDDVFPTNNPSVVDHVITLSPFIPGVDNQGKYIRIEVKFSSNGNVLEHYIRTQITR